MYAVMYLSVCLMMHPRSGGAGFTPKSNGIVVQCCYTYARDISEMLNDIYDIKVTDW